MILKYKLHRTSKHLREHNFIANAQKYAKQIEICEYLIDRLINDEYAELERKKHEEKWGKLLFDGRGIHREKAFSEKEECQERDESIAISTLERQRRDRDLDALFSIMRKRIQYWWD